MLCRASDVDEAPLELSGVFRATHFTDSSWGRRITTDLSRFLEVGRG